MWKLEGDGVARCSCKDGSVCERLQRGWQIKYSSPSSQNVPDALPKRRCVEDIQPQTMGQKLPEILLCSRTYQPP